MSWYWLVAAALGGWTLVSIALGLAFGRVVAPRLNAGHDVVTLEDEAALDDAVYAEALEVAQTAPGLTRTRTTTSQGR